RPAMRGSVEILTGPSGVGQADTAGSIARSGGNELRSYVVSPFPVRDPAGLQAYGLLRFLPWRRQSPPSSLCPPPSPLPPPAPGTCLAPRACPAPASVSVSCENLSADVSVPLALDGHLSDASATCGGVGTTSYSASCTCSGSGLVPCGQVSGLRPGHWVNRVT